MLWGEIRSLKEIVVTQKKLFAESRDVCDQSSSRLNIATLTSQHQNYYSVKIVIIIIILMHTYLILVQFDFDIKCFFIKKHGCI